MYSAPCLVTREVGRKEPFCWFYCEFIHRKRWGGVGTGLSEVAGRAEGSQHHWEGPGSESLRRLCHYMNGSMSSRNFRIIWPSLFIPQLRSWRLEKLRDLSRAIWWEAEQKPVGTDQNFSVLEVDLYFHTNCEIICSSSLKNTIGSLIGIALNL